MISLQVCDLTVERLYTMVLGLSLHEIKVLWFRWLFTDEAGKFSDDAYKSCIFGQSNPFKPSIAILA